MSVRKHGCPSLGFLLLQDRGLEKQRSRLGVSRRSTGIHKVTASALKSALPSALPHASTSPASFPSQDPPPASTAAAAAVSAAAATAVAAAEAVSTSMPLAAAFRVPPAARLGSSSAPHIDRVIALGSRRAPHLAGTRVKIYCSQGGRGIKSRRPVCVAGSDSTTSRRVRQKVEALDLMIWRCECARKVITKGAPIPASTLSGPDCDKPHPQHQSAPLPGLIANQVAARLGAAPSLLANSAGQLLPNSRFSRTVASDAPQLPATVSSSQQEAGTHPQLQSERQVSPDPPELIHQLPSSAPMLAQDESLLFRHADSQPPSEHQQGGRGDRWSPGPSQLKGPAAGHQTRVLSCSPSSSLPSNPSQNPVGSRHSSPGSASLAGLIPSTTAVTVPSPHSSAPYSVISAARAASVGDHTVPVVTIQEAAPSSLPAMAAGAQDAKMGGGSFQDPESAASGLGRHDLLPRLLALNNTLRGQDSVGIPDTPDTECLEHHAALNRQHSSFSKAVSMNGQQDGISAAALQRKGLLSTSGLLDLTMSDALPSEDLEPDMFAAFFADSGALSDKPDPAVSLPLHDASDNNASLS